MELYVHCCTRYLSTDPPHRIPPNCLLVMPFPPEHNCVWKLPWGVWDKHVCLQPCSAHSSVYTSYVQNKVTLLELGHGKVVPTMWGTGGRDTWLAPMPIICEDSVRASVGTEEVVCFCLSMLVHVAEKAGPCICVSLGVCMPVYTACIDVCICLLHAYVKWGGRLWTVTLSLAHHCLNGHGGHIDGLRDVTPVGYMGSLHSWG